jgi:hypothetical protein
VTVAATIAPDIGPELTGQRVQLLQRGPIVELPQRGAIFCGQASGQPGKC